MAAAAILAPVYSWSIDSEDSFEEEPPPFFGSAGSVCGESERVLLATNPAIRAALAVSRISRSCSSHESLPFPWVLLTGLAPLSWGWAPPSDTLVV